MEGEIIRDLEKALERFSSSADEFTRILRKINRSKLDTSIKNIERIQQRTERHSRDFYDIVKKEKGFFRRTFEKFFPGFEKFKIGGFFDKIQRSSEYLDRKIVKTGEYIEKFVSMKGSLQDFINLIPVLGSKFYSFRYIASNIDEYIDFLRETSKVGITFGDSLFDAKIRATEMGLSLSKLSRFTDKYAGAVLKLGLPSVSRLSNNMLRTGNFLSSMGLTVEEMNMYLGEFLDQMRLYDGLRIKDEEYLRKLFKMQVTESYKVTRLTGDSLEEIFREFKRLATDPSFRVFFNTLPEVTRNAVSALLQVSPELRDMMIMFFQRGSIAFSEDFRKLLPLGIAADLRALFRDLQAGSLDAEQTLKRYSEIMSKVSDDYLRTLSVLGNDMYIFGSQLKINANKIAEESGAYVERQDKVNELLLNFERNMITTMSEIVTDVLRTFDTSSKGFAQTLENIFSQIKDYVLTAKDAFISVSEKVKNTVDGFTKLIEESNLLAKAFEKLRDIVSGIYNMFGENGIIATAIAGGFVTLLGGRFIRNLIMFMIRKTFSSTLSGIGSLFRGTLSVLGGNAMSQIATRAGTVAAGAASRGLLSRFLSILRIGGPIGAGLGLGSIVAEEIAENTEEGVKKQVAKTAADVLELASLGATTGAIVGSVVPGVGTAAGTLLGAAGGAAVGLTKSAYDYFFNNENLEEKIEEMVEQSQSRSEEQLDIEKRIEELINTSNELLERINRSSEVNNRLISEVTQKLEQLRSSLEANARRQMGY